MVDSELQRRLYYVPENDGEELTLVEKGPSPKLRMLASDMFLNDDKDEEMGEEEEHKDEEIKKSELEEYLVLSQVPFTMVFDLLGWWKSRSTMWPNLSKMARQLLV